MDHDRAAAGLIGEAFERTRAAASARFELAFRHTWEMGPTRWLRRGDPMQTVRTLGWVAAKRLFKAVAGDLDPKNMIAEGVIDLERRRYMLDFGSYAQLHSDGKAWHGRSGDGLPAMRSDEPDMPIPMWMLDILGGVTAATDEGVQDVRGTPCRRLAATVDIARASERTPGGVAAPRTARFEDLYALPVEVCIDDAHVRRVRRRFEHYTETLDLWDVGVSLDDVDWSRLPTFRSPKRAPGGAGAADGAA